MRRVLLAGAAFAALVHGAAATQWTCGRPVMLVGKELPIHPIKIVVQHDGHRWAISEGMSDGSVMNRSEQYKVEDYSQRGVETWSGYYGLDPRFFMIGTIVKTDKGIGYDEALFDGSHNNYVIMREVSLCRDSTPAPEDAVAIASDGREATVEILLGKFPTTMTIDTGATMMALGPAIGDLLVENGMASEAGKVRVAVADGRVVEERRIIIDRLTIGSHTLMDVPATVHEGMNLLPFTVLNQIGEFTIDTTHKRLIFH
jgi:hypothetical protein